jgi:hypothetical protein
MSYEEIATPVALLLIGAVWIAVLAWVLRRMDRR